MFNWQEQSEEMMNNWLQAQKAMWDGWTQAATQANPFADKMYRQWQETVAEGLRGQPFADSDTARKTAAQFLDAQQTMLNFWQQSARLWADLWSEVQGGAKKGGAEQDGWRQATEAYARTMRQMWQTPGLPQDWSQLWQQYQQQWQNVSQPWLRAWEQGPSAWFQQRGLGEAGKWQDLYWDTYRQTLGKWLDSPTLGLTREFNQKVEAGFDAWMELLQAQIAYQEVLAKIWQQAFQEFMTRTGTLAEEGRAMPSLQEWLVLWTQTGDAVFGEAFRSEEYIRAQANFINASMRYRQESRRIMEVLLQAMDMPTRSEMDDAHQRIYALRKEVKALKKALAALQRTDQSGDAG